MMIWEHAFKPVAAKAISKGFESATQEMLSENGIFQPKVKNN